MKQNVYVSPMRVERSSASLMTPRSKSLFAFVGESAHAYQSPAKDLNFINRRMAQSAHHAAPEAAHSNSGSFAAASVAGGIGASNGGGVGGGVGGAVAAVAEAVEAAEAAAAAAAANDVTGGVHPRESNDDDDRATGQDERISKAARRL